MTENEQAKLILMKKIFETNRAITKLLRKAHDNIDLEVLIEYGLSVEEAEEYVSLLEETVKEAEEYYSLFGKKINMMNRIEE